MPSFPLALNNERVLRDNAQTKAGSRNGHRTAHASLEDWWVFVLISRAIANTRSQLQANEQQVSEGLGVKGFLVKKKVSTQMFHKLEHLRYKRLSECDLTLTTCGWRNGEEEGREAGSEGGHEKEREEGARMGGRS